MLHSLEPFIIKTHRTNTSLLINSKHFSCNLFFLPRQNNILKKQLTSRRPKVLPVMGIPIVLLSEHAQIEQFMTSSTISPPNKWNPPLSQE